MKLTVDYKGSYIADDKSSTVSVYASFRINIGKTAKITTTFDETTKITMRFSKLQK